MEKNALQMRLACSSRLAVPRSQLVALTHLPGRRALLTGTFDAKQSAWTLAGKPAVTGGDLLLNEKGQSASLTLGTPLAGGWFGIDFESRNTPSGGLWVAELTFADSSDPLRITLAGGEWAVAAKGRTGSANKVKLSTGRHRLTVGFSSSALRVLIDDRVLWYSDKGTGKLKSVRLRCESKGKIKGAVAFATYGLEKSVPEHRRPPAEPGQDELWLAGGDQLFGTVIAADSQGVQLKGKTGTGNHAWATLRGWYGKQPKVAPLPRQMVRLGLHNGVSNDLDWLTGTLVSLDTKKVVFKHGILGELSIDRRWVALIAMN